MRHLVSIQEVKEVVPIENADAIELVKILGWQCVAKKGEFNKGDRGIYFEIDSYLPVDDERYEFLRKSSYRNNPFMGEGFRIITQKFRGCLSQGLFLPINQFPELTTEDLEIGTDLTEKLRVKKWDPPEQASNAGNIKGSFPTYGFGKTDETRVQSIDELRTQLLGKPYYISTKMDGTSCTIYSINGKQGVCGRNSEYKDDEDCGMWIYVHRYNIMEKLNELKRNLVVQGEYCGEGIQKNRLRLKNPEIYVFNVIDGDTMKLLPLDEMIEICDKIGMKTVPIEERGDSFNYTLDELLVRATGKYPSGLNKEGIVVRPLIPEFCYAINKELSFKVLNNDFLLKGK